MALKNISRGIEAASIVVLDPFELRHPVDHPDAIWTGLPMPRMKRRDFIGVIGGAAVLWPLASRAQQPERMRRIGVLQGGTENDPEMQRRRAAFRPPLHHRSPSIACKRA